MGRDKNKKFYAVLKGRVCGIYTTWEETRLQTEGYAGSVHKGFMTRAEAERYLGVAHISPIPLKVVKSKELENVFVLPPVRFNDLHIYCDGSALSNGQPGARAGFGVYFGPNDTRNVSRRVDPELYPRQTNQIAELLAAIAALEICLEIKHDGLVTLLTDSTYTIDAATTWRRAWKRKNWNVNLVNLHTLRRLSDLVDEVGIARVTFAYVPAHSGIEGNEEADKLAKAGALM